MNRPLKLVLKIIGFEEIWTLGIRPAGSGFFDKEMPFASVKDLRGSWYADPMLYEHEGRECCFFEMYDRRALRGCIGVAEVTENGLENIRPVIKESFHMSYPTVFALNGTIFMLPECSETEGVRLYRCLDFPDVWECVKVFEGMSCFTDTNVINIEEDTVMLDSSVFDTSDPFRVKSVWSMLKIDEAKQVYELTKLKESGYSYLERNGGPLLYAGNKAYVPKQISQKNDYGLGLNLFEFDIQQLGHEKKAELNILPDMLKTDCGKKVTGIHTFSRGSTVDVIDIRMLVFNPYKWFWRLKKMIHTGG